MTTTTSEPVTVNHTTKDAENKTDEQHFEEGCNKPLVKCTKCQRYLEGRIKL